MLRNIVSAVFVSISFAFFLGSSLPAQTAPEQTLTRAYTLERQGNAASAIALLTPLVDTNAFDPGAAGKAWDVLGLAFQDQGNFVASRQAFEHSVHEYENAPGAASGHAAALDDFAELYMLTGQVELAERMMQRALRLYESAQDHAGVARASNYLAGALLSQRKIREGKDVLNRSIKESRPANTLDEDDLATQSFLQGWLAQLEGDQETTVSKYQQSLDRLRRYHGEDHASTGWSYVLFGKALAENGEVDRAFAEMRLGVGILHRTLSDQDPRVITAELAYAGVLDSVGKRSEAQSLRASAEGKRTAARNANCATCSVSVAALR